MRLFNHEGLTEGISIEIRERMPDGTKKLVKLNVEPGAFQLCAEEEVEIPTLTPDVEPVFISPLSRKLTLKLEATPYGGSSAQIQLQTEDLT